MNDSRRRFVRLSVVFLGGAALAVEGCGGSTGSGTGGGGGATGGGGGGGAASTCLTNGAHDTLITANHGHTLLVPAADFSAAGDKTWDITGSATHGHDVTLTQAQRGALLGGASITVTSTQVDAHVHQVTITCA